VLSAELEDERGRKVLSAELIPDNSELITQNSELGEAVDSEPCPVI
jgi:hypothetical protein